MSATKYCLIADAKTGARKVSSFYDIEVLDENKTKKPTVVMSYGNIIGKKSKSEDGGGELRTSRETKKTFDSWEAAETYATEKVKEQKSKGYHDAPQADALLPKAKKTKTTTAEEPPVVEKAVSTPTEDDKPSEEEEEEEEEEEAAPKKAAAPPAKKGKGKATK